MKKSYKYLIMGGGVAGTTAVQTLRQGETDASIALVTDEPYPFYSRLLLSKPNFFLGKVPFENIWLRKENWYQENRIEFFPGKTSLVLDPVKKMVGFSDGSEFSYQKLLLAIGSRANRWPNPDAQKKGVYYLRTLDDAKFIMEAVKTAHRAILIGGGFVGFEMCEMVRMAGLPATLLVRENFFWDFLWDATSGHMLEAALERGGVKIFTKATVKKFLGGEAVSGVELDDGTQLLADLVIIGIGVNYPIDWLESSGLKTSRGILANEHLETNLPDVWTAGDVAEYYDPIICEQVMMGNWVNAQEHGRTAANNMLGQKRPFRFVSFYTTQGLGISIAFVGDVRPEPDREVIYRGGEELNFYARLLVKNDRLVGATMINRTAELGAISKLIEKNINISDKVVALGDPAFDLKTLIV
ncbi:MAG: NAD(P)/FAD-dependent oxidoreductase [Candidatus Doudnabacteria bacterium]|nr:NAD(P)/FAD-dependent oxidoreductase [Candidatus Doudnabacteria bacterium]